jgi:hypothetical protein
MLREWSSGIILARMKVGELMCVRANLAGRN